MYAVCCNIIVLGKKEKRKLKPNNGTLNEHYQHKTTLTGDPRCSAIRCKEDCPFYPATGLRNVLPQLFPCRSTVSKHIYVFLQTELQDMKRKSVDVTAVL